VIASTRADVGSVCSCRAAASVRAGRSKRAPCRKMHWGGTLLRSPLGTLLDRHHYQLIDVARRQYVMEALTKELNRVTRGRKFRIANW
jgi:hypothetical protein